MADINIQRKKSSPSPWLLILLALVVLGGVAWLLLRADSNTEQQSPGTSPPVAPATGAVALPDRNLLSADSLLLEASAATPEALAAASQRDPACPDYARNGLRILSGVLIELADRADLRDLAVSEKRDVLTSATARLDDSTTSLRPGFVAATGLMQAMQQKAYPALEPAVGDLLNRANQLSGRSVSVGDQQQLREFFTRAAKVVRTLNGPSA